MKTSSNFIDRTGLRHGHLTCLGISGMRERRNLLWTWCCDCGDIVIRKYRKVTSTCGPSCPFSKAMKSKSLTGLKRPITTKTGMEGAKRLYQTYKSRCKKKGIAFNLSFEYFLNITSKNCTYCDSPPMSTYNHKYKNINPDRLRHNEYKYNTIDRIDPSLPYIESNCQPCCRQCNIMKWDYTEDQFRDRIKILYEKLFLKS